MENTINGACGNKKDYYLPARNIESIMKETMGKNMKIDKDVSPLMQEITTEFICFVTSDMIEDIQKENRVTIKGSDIVGSLTKLGFDNISDTLDKLLSYY